MNKVSYKIVGFENLAPESLVPHPDALKIAISSGDSELIDDSIDKYGVMAPLLVSSMPGPDGKRLILDGINRWRSSVAGKVESVPCMLVVCDDVNTVVCETITAIRKRTTGQRIMVFLELHKDAVIEAWKMGQEIGRGGANSAEKQSKLSKSPIKSGVPCGTPLLTKQGIATHLKCKKQDVIAGVDLLVCLKLGMVPIKGGSTGVGFPLRPAKEGENTAWIKTEWGLIMSGGGKLRDWKRTGKGGRSKGKGQNDRQDADIAISGMESAQRSFEKWEKLTDQAQETVQSTLVKMVHSLPDCLVDVLNEELEAMNHG